MIQANNVTLRLGKRALFEDVNIKFTEGNCYGLIGANGAGKSTFLKILSGEIEPSKGDVSITSGQRLSVLKQDHYQYDDHIVLDTVMMGNQRLYEIMKEKEALYAKEDFTDEDGIRASELEGEFADMNGWEAESDAATLLNGLGIPSDIHYTKMADLNGSQKVKVLLAQALFGNPDILLLDFPVVYASARDGYSGLDPDDLGTDMQPLFDTIISAVPVPGGDDEGPLQVLFSTLDYDDYVGRIGVGRIQSGRIRRNQAAVLCGGAAENPREVKISRLYRFEGLKRVEIEEAGAGEIVAVAGISDLAIGETVCDVDHVDPLPFVKIDEPTLSMMFMVNDSPFAGKEGKYVTSRNLRDRLFKEVQTNVSMRVEETESTDMFKVSGRGELHLSILIEQMRRQDYEFAVSRPKVIYHKAPDGTLLEPIEELTIDEIGRAHV